MKTILSFIFILFLIVEAVGQNQLSTTILNGDTIVLYDNKTWDYSKSTLSSESAIVESNGTNCEEIVISETDKFTKRTTSRLKENIILSIDGVDKAAIIIGRAQKNLIIKFLALDGCIEKLASAVFLLEDNSTIEFLNYSGFNCDGVLQHQLSVQKGRSDYLYEKDMEKLNQILNGNIISVRIPTSKNNLDFEIDSSTSDILKSAIECLSK